MTNTAGDDARGTSEPWCPTPNQHHNGPGHNPEAAREPYTASETVCDQCGNTLTQADVQFGECRRCYREFLATVQERYRGRSSWPRRGRRIGDE